MSVVQHPCPAWADALVDSAQLVDVREPAEFASGSLPGAVNIPLTDLLADPSVLDPARRVVLVCRSGNRSGMAAEHLVAHGFTDVVNLAGGVMTLDTPVRKDPS